MTPVQNASAPAGDPALQRSLLVMRLTIGAFFLVWALEKLIAPELTARVFQTFYFSNPSVELIYAMGAAQTLVVLAFLAGLWKVWTYGALLVMHALSTFSTWERLINPYEPPNHLFWAAVPVLGALLALFLLRKHDRLWSF